MTPRLLLALIPAALWLTACTKPAEPLLTTDDTTPATHDTTDRLQTAAAVYQRPPAAMPLPDPEPLITINQGAGVLNPRFDEHIDQIPSYWNVGGRVRVLTGGYDGSPALAAYKGSNVTLSQELHFDESPAGKTITLTAHAMTTLPEAATIRIQLGRRARQTSDPHPGDGQWHQLTTAIQVPDDYDSNAVTISLHHDGRDATEIFAGWFDEVKVYAE
jgi:hypothetical protein